jgi:threonine synthase
MRYTSTCDGSISCSFEEALCSGYSPDGGLFVPEIQPGDGRLKNTLSNAILLQQWAKMTYPDLTFALLRLFISTTEVSDDVLRQICQASLNGFTDPNHAVPVVEIRGSSDDDASLSTPPLYIAELYHGPTFCFKDLGMRPVIQLLSYFSTRRNRPTILLVATTGDTGPAAVQAVADVHNPLLNIVVHYPHHQISEFQRKSLTTVNSPQRVKVVAYEGGGDDMDVPIKNILASHGQDESNKTTDATVPSSSSSSPEQNNSKNNNTDVLLTGVNSYNIGRPLMQMVHFVWTYLRVVEQLGYFVSDDDDEAPVAGTAGSQQQQQATSTSLPVVDFVLPTGAMGNLAAGYMAKTLLGLPIGKLNAGVNINDITHRVLQTGAFHRHPVMYQTLSEAINIQVPYNFERLLFYVTHGNHALVRAWMMEMNNTDDSGDQKLNLNHDWLLCLQRDFSSARVTDDEMCATMRTYLESPYNYLVDPNTAVALCAAQKLGYTNVTIDTATSCTARTNTTKTASSSPGVVVAAAVAILATASPCKFQEAVTAAIGAEKWSHYYANNNAAGCFPAAAKRILQLPEIPPILYHKEAAEDGKFSCLADAQVQWEQQTRDIISQLIQAHPATTTT